jgi:hypothetical protein
MRAPSNRLPLSDVRRLWGRWMLVIQRCLRPGWMRKKVSGHDYERLHADLMKQCYLYLQSDELVQRHVFQQIYTVLAPWTSLATMREANPQLLATLLPQCEELEQELRRLQRREGRLPWRMVTAALLMGLAAGIGYFAMTYGEQAGTMLGSEWRLTLARSKLTLARLSLLEKVSVVTLVVVVVGLWMNWSVKKS